jgi:hypothetical protein
MRLLAMDPDQPGGPTPTTDLESWAAQTVPMLRAALPRHVRLECRIAPGLSVHVARHRLAQAVFNLVQNAGEAIGPSPDAGPHAGEVRISAAAVSGGSAGQIVVSDNGPGMPPEVRVRCFEPYFSTKGRAIATGMGLGMVKGIVEGAGGSIAVQSAPGKGTEFTLTLPAARAQHQSQAAAPLATGAVTLANRRIASLACMLIEQLELKPVRHPGPEAPSAALWVLDNPDPARLARYLEPDPLRRAVVLSAAPPPAAGHGRVISLPEHPSPAALRDALVSCRPAPARVPAEDRP